MKATFVAALLGGSHPASACSVMVDPDRTYWDKKRDVQEYVSRADAIIDGEVVQPMTDRNRTAIVAVHRVFKGSVSDKVEVVEADSCSMFLDRQGERRRMILTKHEGSYTLYYDGSNERLEDKLLKSDRRKDWPYFAGKAEQN